uniref:Fringe glycosyltransferase n=1 Tax=Parastrongyloides trichosuri TaxID=131310 RepID=A0A0N4ZH24_PARTI
MKYYIKVRNIYFIILFTILLFKYSKSFPIISKLDEKNNISLTITVKTTSKNYGTRIQDILSTWYQKLPDNIWFISDEDDESISTLSNKHLIPTNCGTTHTLSDLVCKMQKELEVFVNQDSDWSCHFDDDNYVNVEKLIQMLKLFNPHQPYFFGKRSIKEPFYVNNFNLQFATGGAGFCISNWILKTIEEDVRNGVFLDIALNYRLPDDMAFSYFLEHNHNFPLIIVSRFHSHLEALPVISHPEDEISLSYDNVDNGSFKFGMKIPQICLIKNDPRHMKGLHCMIELLLKGEKIVIPDDYIIKIEDDINFFK